MKKTSKKLNFLKATANQPNRLKIEKKREKIKRQLKRVEKKILNPSPNISSKIKSNKIKENKLASNPIFIKFLNWKGDKYSIEIFMDRLIESFEKEEDRKTVLIKKMDLQEFYLNNLSSFRDVFRKNILDMINQKNISENFLLWLNNAFNYIEEQKDSYLNDEFRSISIKGNNDKWFESLVCYNFIMTFNYFGIDIIKNCPVCNSFFCHKGPYAKYCSDGCKEFSSKGK